MTWNSICLNCLPVIYLWHFSPMGRWLISAPSYSGSFGQKVCSKNTSMSWQMSPVRDPGGAERLRPLQFLHSCHPVWGVSPWVQRATGVHRCCWWPATHPHSGGGYTWDTTRAYFFNCFVHLCFSRRNTYADSNFSCLDINVNYVVF